MGMAASITAFDSFAYFERLKAAGVPEPQAKVHAETFREAVRETVRETFRENFREHFEALNEEQKKDLATKGDIVAVRTDVAAVRTEVAAVRADLRETELRLQKEIKEVELRLLIKMEATKHDLLKWVIGMAVAQTGVLATLFALMK